MIVLRTAAIFCAVLFTSTTSASAQAALRASASREAVERNPRRLDVVQLLDQPSPNGSERVRFQWDQVPGATEYVLSGKWTSHPSWTIHSSEHRVTQKTASEWNAEKVLFELTLPAGNHSWELVAVFRSSTSGDFEHPTSKSFEIR